MCLGSVEQSVTVLGPERCKQLGVYALSDMGIGPSCVRELYYNTLLV